MTKEPQTPPLTPTSEHLDVEVDDAGAAPGSRVVEDGIHPWAPRVIDEWDNTVALLGVAGPPPDDAA